LNIIWKKTNNFRALLDGVVTKLTLSNFFMSNWADETNDEVPHYGTINSSNKNNKQSAVVPKPTSTTAAYVPPHSRNNARGSAGTDSFSAGSGGGRRDFRGSFL
jgi:hypothetical protein